MALAQEDINLLKQEIGGLSDGSELAQVVGIAEGMLDGVVQIGFPVVMDREFEHFFLMTPCSRVNVR